MTAGTIALLPCPFCGDIEPELDDIAPKVHVVCCPTCRLIGPHNPTNTTIAEAAKLWNKRRPA